MRKDHAMNHGERNYTVVSPSLGSEGLGDVLVMMKSSIGRTDIVYELPAKIARFAPLFYGIAPVFVRSDDDWTQPVNGVPPLRLSREEMWMANAAARSMSKALVAIKIDCAPAWAHLRQGDTAKWQTLVDKLSERFQVVQIGMRSHHTPLAGALQIMDVSVRELAAIYGSIGRYVGVDTGDMHLALAAGAKCWVARPPDCPDYRHADWEYKNDRIKYFPLDNPELINDSI